MSAINVLGCDDAWCKHNPDNVQSINSSQTNFHSTWISSIFTCVQCFCVKLLRLDNGTARKHGHWLMIILHVYTGVQLGSQSWLHLPKVLLRLRLGVGRAAEVFDPCILPHLFDREDERWRGRAFKNSKREGACSGSFHSVFALAGVAINAFVREINSEELLLTCSGVIGLRVSPAQTFRAKLLGPLFAESPKKTLSISC